MIFTKGPATVCNCGQTCTCYLDGKFIVSQHMEDDPLSGYEYDDEGLFVAGVVCVVKYQTGEVQRLIRPWMDMNPPNSTVNAKEEA